MTFKLITCYIYFKNQNWIPITMSSQEMMIFSEDFYDVKNMNAFLRKNLRKKIELNFFLFSLRSML